MNATVIKINGKEKRKQTKPNSSLVRLGMCVMLNETREVNMQRWPALKWNPSNPWYEAFTRDSLQIHSQSGLRGDTSAEAHDNTAWVPLMQYLISRLCARGEIAYVYLYHGEITRLISLKLTKGFKIWRKCCAKTNHYDLESWEYDERKRG